MSIPLFEEHALASIERVRQTFCGRGVEYGDTMRDCQFLKMKAVAGALGYEIKPEHFRALCIAGFGDMKYARLLGGYKDDSIIDGIAYDAFLAEEMKVLTGR